MFVWILLKKFFKKNIEWPLISKNIKTFLHSVIFDTAVPPAGWASPHGAQSGPILQIKMYNYFNDYQFLKA